MSEDRIPALFPGQGSQRVGMGRDLYEKSELARTIFKRADEALGFSLTKVCFEGPQENLTRTEIAQPAIYTTSVISFLIAQEVKGRLPIVAAAGHSLGEYSALTAAGALSFEDGVTLVNRRGRYMQEAVPVGTGKMVAVLGKEVLEIEAVLGQVKSGVAEIANINAPGQVVVSGSVAAVDEFVGIFKGAKVMPLQVSAPFHCSLMTPAAEKLAVDLDRIQFKSPCFSVYSNVTAAPVKDSAEIKLALKNQVCGRVRWVESIQGAISSDSPSRAIEFGSGAVLSGLLKRINAVIPRVECGTMEQIEAL